MVFRPALWVLISFLVNINAQELSTTEFIGQLKQRGELGIFDAPAVSILHSTCQSALFPINADIRSFCQVVMATDVCKSVEKADLVNCDHYGATTDFNVVEFLSGCTTGLFDSAKELLKFIWNVLRWVWHTISRPADRLQEASEYVESVKLYLVNEYDKAYEREGSRIRAASAVATAIGNMLLKGIQEVLYRGYQGFGCLNFKARTNMACQVAGEIIIPPASALALLKNGAKAIKGIEKFGDIVKGTKKKSLQIKKSAKASHIPYYHYEKIEILERLGIESDKYQKLLALAYLRGPDAINKQNKILRDLGVTSDKIQQLRKKNFFKIDDLEYQRLTTIPPISKKYVQPGTVISRVNKNGNLTDVIVEKVEGGKIIVKEDTFFQKAKEVIPLKDAYWPVGSRREVLIIDRNGIPKIRNNVVELFSENQQNVLGLKPRPRTTTGLKDLSKAIDKATERRIDDSIIKLELMHGIMGESATFIKANNKFMRMLQIEMKKQGISTSLVSLDSPALSLVMNGVEKNGNKVARRYMKIGEVFGSKKLTISLADNLKNNASGFNVIDSSRTEIGYEMVLNMLKKQEDLTPLHELRHQMFNAQKRYKKNSNIDNSFSAVDADLDLGGKKYFGSWGYSSYFFFEEIYNQSFDVYNLARKLNRSADKNVKIRRRQYLLLKSEIKKELKLSKEAIVNTRKLLHHMLENLDNVKIWPNELRLDGIITLGDRYQRTMAIRLSPDIRGKVQSALNQGGGTLKYADSMKLQELVREEVRKTLQELSDFSQEMSRQIEQVNQVVKQQDHKKILQEARKLANIAQKLNKDGPKGITK